MKYKELVQAVRKALNAKYDPLLFESWRKKDRYERMVETRRQNRLRERLVNMATKEYISNLNN